MAITYVGVGTADNGITTCTPTLPTHNENDLLLINVAVCDDGATESVATPSGYTLLVDNRETVDDTFGNMVFGKIATASESNPAITFTNAAAGDQIIAQACAFRGTHQTIGSVVDASNKGTFTEAESLTDEIPHVALTVANDNTAIVAIGGKRTFWASTVAALTTDSLSWNRIGEADTSAGDDIGLVWDYVIQTTKANISTGKWDLTSATDDDGGSIMLSIAPPASSATAYYYFRNQ
jgi:hypothetical protein